MTIAPEPEGVLGSRVMSIPKNTLEWEAIEETYDPPQHPPNSYQGYTYRAPVPGGWLVAIWAGKDDFDHAWGGGLTFVPDPKHEWKVAIRPLRNRPKPSGPTP
jgi:hypothetical protein